jgi:hypothetical protein
MKEIKFVCILVLALTFFAFSLAAQEVRRTMIFDKEIKSLQVRVDGKPEPMPILEMGITVRAEIVFDTFGHDYKRFRYEIEYCDADWRPSALSPSEYMDGLPGSTINDYAGSINTTVEYVNYMLIIPNDDVRLKLPGNYAVRVFRENDMEKPVFIACFSLLSDRLSITGEISGNTAIDYKEGHQQVNFIVKPGTIRLNNIQSELKFFVYQNGRRDNVSTGFNPTSITSDRIVFEKDRRLVFDAGNEYRRFEFLSPSYNWMGVENIRFFKPYYHVTLIQDSPRKSQVYHYDQDHQGRYFIRCRNCSAVDRESDYYFVHFSLKMPEIPGGNLYIFGDMNNNNADNQTRLAYNHANGTYEGRLLLKQGHYNYMYMFKPEGKTALLPYPVEGNFYQSSNEYTIMVYHRPFGSRYDSLIGVAELKN